MRQTDNPIFYKVEIYLNRLLVSEMRIMPNFVKIVRAVLDIYVSCNHGQTDNPNFYNVETSVDRLLVPEIYIIPIFVKIIRAVLKI